MFIFENLNFKLVEDDEEIGYIPTMLLPEVDEEEVKEGKGIKILTPNKLLTRLPILRNNSCKLRNEIKQIAYILYQRNKTTKKLYNDLNQPLYL